VITHAPAFEAACTVPMGVCLACLKSVFALPTDVDPNDEFVQSQVESPLITETEPLITAQPQPQQDLSKSASKRRSAKQSAAASQATESTPLLSAEVEPIGEAVDPDVIAGPLQEATIDSPSLTDSIRLAQVNLDPFIQYSQKMATKRDADGLSRRPYWEVIHSKLKLDTPGSNVSAPEFVDLQSLLTIAQNPDPDEVIRYLCSVAKKHENLRLAVDQYVAPLL
jgi:hypothetical protein